MGLYGFFSKIKIYDKGCGGFGGLSEGDEVTQANL
jgi:hypothetical protein